MTTWLLVLIAVAVAVAVRPLEQIGDGTALGALAVWLTMLLIALVLAFGAGRRGASNRRRRP